MKTYFKEINNQIYELKTTEKAIKYVLRKYPNAKVISGFRASGIRDGDKTLGTGWTDNEAWIDAMNNIKEKKR